MHIGVVTTWYPSRKSPGSGSFIARDIAALARVHDVTVLHLVPKALDDGDRNFLVGDVRVTRVVADVRTPLGAMAARKRATAFLADVDVLHTMAAPALLPWILRSPGRAWVHTEHWSGIPNIAGPGRARLLRPLARKAFGGPDVVVAVSQYLARAVGVLRTERIDVVGNIVGVVEAPPRTEHPSPPEHGGLRIVAVGNLIAHKGWSIFIEAVRILREQNHDVHGVWVGDGADREQFDAAVGAAGLEGHIRVTGQVAPDSVRDELARADVFVLPTRLETFSLATAEALIEGVPVVVTGTGGHIDMVTPESGRVVARTAQGVAAGILDVAQTCSRAGALARGAELAERLSESSFQANYTRVYEELVSKRVDIVLAVHDVRRRIDRALASVVRQGENVCALVVCHNVSAADVRTGLGALGESGQVRFLEHHDTLGSPSGPFNAGLRASNAPWVGILGSDDELADGAVDAWLAVAQGPAIRGNVDAVVPRLVRGTQNSLVRSPPVRPLRVGARRRRLDIVKDRLSYRSAPLGLIRRAAIERLGLELEEGARNGGDLPFATRLWSAGKIVSALDAPPYIEHADAPTRVTHEAKPVADELAPLTRLLATGALATMKRAECEALVVKLFRRNIKGAVLKREAGLALTDADLVTLGQVSAALLGAAPRLPRILSRADAALLSLLSAPDHRPSAADVAGAYRRADNLRTFGALMVGDPRLIWHREAPLRYVFASASMR